MIQKSGFKSATTESDEIVAISPLIDKDFCFDGSRKSETKAKMKIYSKTGWIEMMGE